jgi:hypothetical protein
MNPAPCVSQWVTPSYDSLTCVTRFNAQSTGMPSGT